MNEKVTQIVELLFRDVKMTEEVQALHDEVLNNCTDRYQDLISRGIMEEEALAAVHESLKGMEEVLKEYPRQDDGDQGTEKTEKPDETESVEEPRQEVLNFRPEEIRTIRAEASACDFDIRASEDGSFRLDKVGDIKVSLENGTLSIRQESLAKPFFCDVELGPENFSSFAAIGDTLRSLAKSLTGGIRAAVTAQDARVAILLPRDLNPNVRLFTTAGDVTWKDAIPGKEFTIETTSGDVNVEIRNEDLLAGMKMTSTSGDLEVTANAAEVFLHTISGEISFNGDAGYLEASSTSGDTDISGRIKKIRMNTTSGDVDLELREDETVEVTVNSVSGDIELRVPENVKAVSAIQQSVSGEMSLHGLENRPDASIRIDVHTVSGDLDIEN